MQGNRFYIIATAIKIKAKINPVVASLNELAH